MFMVMSFEYVKMLEDRRHGFDVVIFEVAYCKVCSERHEDVDKLSRDLALPW